MNEVCEDAPMEAKLQPLTGERPEGSTDLNIDEALRDVSARGFCSAGQIAFLDIRVFNPSPDRSAN